MFSEYTHKNIPEILEELKTSPSGLSQEEAVLRKKQYGQNEITSGGIDVWDIIMRQFNSPFFYLLLIAGLISFFIGEKIDSIVIIVFISINVVLGFFQEFKSERTVSLLKNIISQKTKVLRNGIQKTVEKKELVPGDMVSLVQGDIVPAELRVVDGQNLLVDESALTGESAPILKTGQALLKEEKEIYKAKNILFTGTCVVSGSARAVIIGTGKNTAFGQIAKSVSQKRPKGTYEKDLAYFCKLILRIVLVTVLLVFLLNLLIKGTANIFEFSLFCVALIVSILPEALPAIVILALSSGSLKMAKENVVVKRLSAIEDLGNLEILCTDKTGTLTQNKLSLEKVVSLSKDKTMAYGLLGAAAKAPGNPPANPFDAALFERANYAVLADLKKFTVIKELPFDSFRMRSSFLAEDSKGQKILVTKGAPERVLKICSSLGGNYARNEIKENIEKEGQDGKRVLMVAYKKINKHEVTKEDEKGLTFLGYFVFDDPLKSTAEEAIRLSKKLGVKIKVITGDSKEVAGFVSKQTGLIANTSEVILGEELEKMQTDEFDNACEDHAVFARISPDIKHKIIKSLQKKYDVGFMGEGINDVPALKTANVGIAVSEATDIAKEAADIVLLKKDLRVVVNGVRDGRIIFANINKYIKYALANNFGNFYSIAAISLFINFLPMLPVQILLGNLLADFPAIAIATDSVDIEELRKPKMYQLHMVLPLIIALGLASTVFDFIFFLIFYKNAPSTVQTLWFVESILTEIFLIFIIRTRHKFWKAKNPSFWLVLCTAISGLFILVLPFTGLGQQFFHFATPPLFGLFVVFLIIIAYIIANETIKLVYYHYFKPPKPTDG